MTRDELIEMIADYAGPLGPLRTPEQHEALFHARAAEASAGDFELLLALLETPPPIASHPAVRESWLLALEQGLTLLGRKDPTRALEALEPVLASPAARPVAVAVIGGLEHPEGVSRLRPLLTEPDLGVEELVSLACALGEIGGVEADALLGELLRGPAGRIPEVREEIEIAVANRR